MDFFLPESVLLDCKLTVVLEVHIPTIVFAPTESFSVAKVYLSIEPLAGALLSYHKLHLQRKLTLTPPAAISSKRHLSYRETQEPLS